MANLFLYFMYYKSAVQFMMCRHMHSKIYSGALLAKGLNELLWKDFFLLLQKYVWTAATSGSEKSQVP